MVESMSNSIMESSFTLATDPKVLCLAPLADKDTPIKLMFCISPPPGLEEYHKPPGFPTGHNTSDGVPFTSTHGSDSESCRNSRIPEEVEEEQESHKHNRPCRAKRNRYKKLVYRLEMEILANAGSFDFEALISRLPPSLQNNHEQRQKLIQRMYDFKHQVTSCSL